VQARLRRTRREAGQYRQAGWGCRTSRHNRTHPAGPPGASGRCVAGCAHAWSDL